MARLLLSVFLKGVHMAERYGALSGSSDCQSLMGPDGLSSALTRDGAGKARRLAAKAGRRDWGLYSAAPGRWRYAIILKGTEPSSTPGAAVFFFRRF